MVKSSEQASVDEVDKFVKIFLFLYLVCYKFNSLSRSTANHAHTVHPGVTLNVRLDMDI